MSAQDLPANTLPPAYTAPVLLLNFSWKRFHVLVAEEHKPTDASYTINIKTTLGPHVVLRSSEDSTAIGTGTLHAFSINPDLEIHGHSGRLKALKRFKTEYTLLSRAYSDTIEPTTLQWKSKSGFTSWDFICVDETGITVAVFSANLFAFSKAVRVGFYDTKAYSIEAREEILLVGMTLYYCMISRTYNVFNLFGAVLTRPGQPQDTDASTPVETDKPKAQQELYGPKLNV